MEIGLNDTKAIACIPDGGARRTPCRRSLGRGAFGGVRRLFGPQSRQHAVPHGAREGTTVITWARERADESPLETNPDEETQK